MSATLPGIEIKDGGRHYRARLARIERPDSEAALRAVLEAARREGRKVSLRGAGRSQGGLTISDDAVLIDMTGFDKILDINPVEQTARVQAGVTWDQLREALNPYGLSTRSNQSYGVFTVGGSVSVNAHGRNIDTGVVGSTISAMRVMLADGSVAEVSRTCDAELFSLVLGGFGLFGIVLEVTLRLTRNDRYVKSGVTVMPIEQYPRHFETHVRPDAEIHFHYARLSIGDGERWRRLYCLDYRREADDGEPLAGERVHEPDGTRAQRLMLWCTRHFRWARRLRFPADVLFRIKPERTRRNNVAKESIKVIDRRRGIYWLQEFFIPVENFSAFVEQARRVIDAENFRLLNTTIRFVPKNTDAYLSYAPVDRFSFVIFFDQPLDARAIRKTEAVLRRLLDSALDCDGTHYLCYQRFATHEQLRRAYPAIDEFFALKRRYDPHALFDHQFYRQYARPEPMKVLNAGAAMSKSRKRRLIYDRDHPPPRLRKLRLPPAEHFSFTTDDGVELRLERYRGGERGPVVLAAGYSMAARVFTLDTLDTNLAEYLCERGYDVWLFSWRSSPDVAACRTRFTLDDVARFDWPAALRVVRQQTQAPAVDCVVHCIGSQTLLMSMLLGRLDGAIRSAVCLQTALHYDTPLLTRLKSWSRVADVLNGIGLRYIDASANTHNGRAYRLLDAALTFFPISAKERCNNPTCRRSAFLWGELINHANLSEATHERMGDLLGEAPLYPFLQMTRSTRHGKIMGARGEDIYLPQIERLRLPITFIHGGDNATFYENATRRTYELLCRVNGPERYRRHVIAGYGHMDCLVGRDVARDVFPRIGEHFERLAATTPRESAARASDAEVVSTAAGISEAARP